MENTLFQSLSSTSVVERQKSIELLRHSLENGESFKDEVFKRLIPLIMDINANVAIKAMDCIDHLSKHPSYQQIWSQLRNNSVIDSLFGRLADGKAELRNKAKEVLTNILPTIDPQSFMAKMVSLMNSRNVYLKRNIVALTSDIVKSNLCKVEVDPESAKNICSVGIMAFNDVDNGVREAGLQLLRVSFSCFGESFEIFMKERGAQADILAKVNVNTSLLNRASSRLNLLQNKGVAAPLGDRESQVLFNELAVPMNGIPVGLNPQAWLPFVNENPSGPLDLKTETETLRLINRIEQDLRDQDDWQKRAEALISLHSLALGSLRETPQATTFIRSLQDLLDAQLADLRSVITKECCRTLAAVALRLKGHSVPLLELCWPKIMKLLVSKTQTISHAADILVRVLVFSCEDSKLLSWFADLVRSKSAVHRRLGLEYCLLAASRWPSDMIDRCFPYLQSSLRLGLTDADGEARKVARLLFRLLQSYKTTATRVKRMEAELDSTALKYLQSDEQPIVDIDYLNSLRSLTLEISPESIQLSTVGSETAVAAPVPVPDLVDDNMDWLNNALSLDDDDQDMNTSFGNTRRNTFATGVGLSTKTGNSNANKRMSLAGPMRILAPPSASSTMQNEASNVIGSQISARPRRMSMSTVVDLAAVINPATVVIASQVALNNSGILLNSDKENNRRASIAPGTAMLVNRRESIGALTNGPRRILQPVQISSSNVPAVEIPVIEKEAECIDKAPLVKTSSSVAMSALKQPKANAPPVQPLSNLDAFKALLPTKGGLLKALEMYRKHLSAGSEDALGAKFLAEAFTSVLDGLVDTNTKVASEAVEIMDMLIPASREKFSWLLMPQKISTMIKYMFCALCDGKPVIRDHIQRLLTVLRTHLPHATLFAATMATLKDIAERAMAAAFQFAGAILTTSDDYFQITANVQDFLVKMLSTLVVRKISPVAQLAGKRVLIKAIETQMTMFVKVISGMTLAQQTSIKSLLNNRISADLEVKLLQQTKKEKASQQQQSTVVEQEQQRSALATQLLQKVAEVTTRMSPVVVKSNEIKANAQHGAHLEQIVLQTCRSPSIITNSSKVASPPPVIPFQCWQEDPSFAPPLPAPQPVKTIEWILDGLQQSCLSTQHKAAVDALTARINIGDTSLFEDNLLAILLGVLKAIQRSHKEEQKLDTIQTKQAINEALQQLYKLLLKMLPSLQSKRKLSAISEEEVRSILAGVFSVIQPVYPPDLFHEQLLHFLASLLVNLMAPSSENFPWSMVEAVKVGVFAGVNANLDSSLSILTAIRGFDVMITSMLRTRNDLLPEEKPQIYSFCQEVAGFLVPLCVGHEIAEIRRQSTLILANLYCKLGSDMLPWIESMSKHQRKVLMVYVHKAEDALPAN